jgi:hypothetical protein
MHQQQYNNYNEPPFTKQLCYCPGPGQEMTRTEVDLFATVSSILGTISALIAIYNFVNGRRKRRKRQTTTSIWRILEQSHMQQCYIPSTTEGAT